MFGIIKDNKLMGLYHAFDYCQRLQLEQRTRGGEVRTLSRTVKKTSRFHCRYCIYLEAEEKGIECYKICPQLACLNKEKIPAGLRWEIEAYHGLFETTEHKELYHCTKRANVKRILREGIKAKIPNVDNGVKGVYLSVKPFDWMHYATDETMCAGCLIKIDAAGLPLKPDIGILELEDPENHPAFIFEGDIPAERILQIMVSTDKKPAMFRELKVKP